MTSDAEWKEHEEKRTRLLTSSRSKYLRFSRLYLAARSGSLCFCGGPPCGGSGGGPITTSCGGAICGLGVWLMKGEGQD